MKTNEVAKINFPLPFYLPIEDGTQTVCSYKDFASFNFICTKMKNESYKSIGEIEEYCTLITLYFSYNYEKVVDVEVEEFLRKAVINSITYLNNFIDAFRIENNLEYIKNFTITDLPPIIEIEISGKTNLYITAPTTIGVNKIQLNKDALIKTQQRMMILDKSSYIEVIDKFQSKAIHHLHTEDFLSAIIELQTSFESYIRLCHKIILTMQGADDTRIENAKDFPLKNTIIDHIGKALFEDFDFNRNIIFKNWFENLYTLRNKIVHSGHNYITGNEAYKAYDSYVYVVTYITKLMIKFGYMNSEGEVSIFILNKNTKENVDSDMVIAELKKRGMINIKNYT